MVNFDSFTVFEQREDADITEKFLNNLPKTSAQDRISSDCARTASGCVEHGKL